jgi:hypothetical protein
MLRYAASLQVLKLMEDIQQGVLEIMAGSKVSLILR